MGVRVLAPSAGAVHNVQRRKARPAAAQRTVLPPEISQKFIPSRSSQGIVYQPVLLASAQIRFIDAKSKVDYLQDVVLASPVKDDNTPVEWEESFEIDIAPDDLENEPIAGAEFAPLPADAAKPKSYTAWSKDLVTWIYSNRKIDLFCSPGKECSNPGESEGDFRARVQHTSREQRDAAVEKLRQKYASKVTVLQDRLRRSEQAVAKKKSSGPHPSSPSARIVFGVCLRTQERHDCHPRGLTHLQGTIGHRTCRRNLYGREAAAG